MLNTRWLNQKQYDKVRTIMTKYAKRSLDGKGRLFTRLALEEINQKIRGGGEANSPSFVTHNEAAQIEYKPEKDIPRGTYDLSVFKLAKTPAQEALRLADYAKAKASGRKSAPKKKASAKPKKAAKRMQVRKGAAKRAPKTAPASEPVAA